MQKIYLLIGIFGVLQNTANAQCITVSACPASPVTECDITANNAQLWNEPSWNDPVLNIHDLPESPIDLQISASSNCGGAISIHYELQLDLDGNGTQETVINSSVAQAPGEVLFDNASGSGTARTFDERFVATDQKYVFALETSLNAGTTTASVRWNTTATPGVFTVPELPYGTHKIKWVIEDGLGNQEVCEYSFLIKDCKKPTVVCLNGLAVNIMPTGFITLWASDFLNYMEDNTTPANLLKMGIRKSGTGTGFPVDGNGEPIVSVNFNCLELGTQVIELWSIDKAGNADYCEAAVSVEDINGNCNGITDGINVSACERRWCDQSIVAGVEMTIFSTSNNNPSSSITLTVGPTGCIDKLVPPATSIGVSLSIDSDPLNGVDVFDLIAISKHILGIEPFTSPYAIIAADANKSNSITVFDIIEIRKLMLGIYAELPANVSWRFVDAGFVFPNPSNPFQSQFSEGYISNPLPPNDSISLNFYGIKVGDVNCSAIPGLKSEHNDDRSSSTLLSMPDLFMEAGEIRDIPLQLAEAKRLLGFQMGLQFDPQQLSIEEVQSGSLPGFDAATCTAQPAPGYLNSVWFDVNPTEITSGEAMMTLRVRALRAGWLHEMLRITNGADGNLHSEACLYDATRTQLQLEFRTAQPEQHQVVVYAPQPNPTSAGTTIRVQLPETEQVTLQITDLNGKLLYEQRVQLPKGTQSLDVPASAFSQGGVYLWRIETAASRSAGRLIRT